MTMNKYFQLALIEIVGNVIYDNFKEYFILLIDFLAKNYIDFILITLWIIFALSRSTNLRYTSLGAIVFLLGWFYGDLIR
jgi:hypothetical protein